MCCIPSGQFTYVATSRPDFKVFTTILELTRQSCGACRWVLVMLRGTCTSGRNQAQDLKQPGRKDYNGCKFAGPQLTFGSFGEPEP